MAENHELRVGGPTLLLVSDVAAILRTSPKAIYAMFERGLLPGVVRIGRRVSMTQRYMHLSPAALDAAIRLLEEPARAAGMKRHGSG